MVVCRNCGGNNPDGQLKCGYCGKPLSLIPNNDIRSNVSINNNNTNDNTNRNISDYGDIHNYYDKSNINNNYNTNNYDTSNNINNLDYNNINDNMGNKNYDNQPIKSSYINNPNKSFDNNDYNNNRYNNDSNNRNIPNYTNIHNQNPNFNQQYKDIDPTANKFESGTGSVFNKEKYVDKNSIEWDVVIATALITLILSAILNRIFPTLGLLFAIFVGLIYILIATKVKSSLVKSLPVTLIVICAISAFFSL